MGRQANAVDWAEDGGGVLRVIADSEIRLRERRPLQEEVPLEDDEPTRPVARLTLSACDAEPLSARGIARLSALADWLSGEESAGAAVSLVREFLRGMDRVHESLSALVTASADASAAPRALGLEAAVHALALVVGMWRGNMVDQVDDLALSDHRSLRGWSSLPEYSCAYALAFIRPALSDARAWAIATGGAPAESATLVAAIDAIDASVRELNATLRAAIDAETRSSAPLASLRAAVAW
jgi:hypothetical protein